MCYTSKQLRSIFILAFSAACWINGLTAMAQAPGSSADKLDKQAQALAKEKKYAEAAMVMKKVLETRASKSCLSRAGKPHRAPGRPLCGRRQACVASHRDQQHHWLVLRFRGVQCAWQQGF